MTLRAKLVISLTVLLLVVIASVGLVASRSIESILVDQIDRILVGFVNRGPGFGPLPPGSGELQGTTDQEGVLRRDTAEMLIDANGEVVVSRPSGFADAPDPLPDVSDLPDGSGPMNLPSVDGTLEYRAVVLSLPNGIGTVVRAIPLTDVGNATSALVRTLALAGAGVLLLGGAATWWTVERSMEPVEQMVETAEAIAAGDLTRRVPASAPGTELGRLADSINAMLSHIEEAVEAERDGQNRLRQFVADASHELRTPITAISGYAELRRRGGLASEEADDNAWSRVEAESRRMGSLIEDLIMLARLGQTQPLEVAEVDLAEIARDAVADHSAIDPERPVTIAGPDSILMEGDKERLHQVVSSLLANTRVHTPPGTLVRVETKLGDGTVELSVSDDGPGIPEASLEQVFERFFRSDPSRSRRSGGSGLGLAIVRAIVEAHGGTVSAANIDDLGARFTVRLPVRPD